MSGKLFKSERSRTVSNCGDHYAHEIAKLVSAQPIAASRGILLDVHIDPQIPAQAGVEPGLAQKTLLPLITRTIENTPWSRLDISFQLCKLLASQRHVEMKIWGNGYPLGQYIDDRRMVMQQTPIAYASSTNTGHSHTVTQQRGQRGSYHLATTRFHVQSTPGQSLSWQITDPAHEAALLLSDDQVLTKQVDSRLSRYHLLTSHADSLTKACRTIVSNGHKRTFTTVLVDARLGDKTLNKYSPLLRDVASPGTKLILLTHNAITHSLIRKYHAAGYFAVVNMDSDTELTNAMYAAATFYATGSTTNKV